MIKKVVFPIIFLISFIFLTSLACSSSSSTPVVISPSEQINTQVPDTLVAPTEEQKAVGTSRSNPAPVGSEIISDDMSFVVTGITRPADSIVAQGNMFNTTPEPDKEYIFVKVNVTCKLPSDGKCSLYTSNFKMINSSGNVSDSEYFLTGVSGLLEDQDFFGGASIDGNIGFIIDKSETAPILMYEPFLGDAFYLQIQ